MTFERTRCRAVRCGYLGGRIERKRRRFAHVRAKSVVRRAPRRSAMSKHLARDVCDVGRDLAIFVAALAPDFRRLPGDPPADFPCGPIHLPPPAFPRSLCGRPCRWGGRTSCSSTLPRASTSGTRARRATRCRRRRSRPTFSRRRQVSGQVWERGVDASVRA